MRDAEENWFEDSVPIHWHSHSAEKRFGEPAGLQFNLDSIPPSRPWSRSRHVRLLYVTVCLYARYARTAS